MNEHRNNAKFFLLSQTSDVHHTVRQVYLESLFLAQPTALWRIKYYSEIYFSWQSHLVLFFSYSSFRYLQDNSMYSFSSGNTVSVLPQNLTIGASLANLANSPCFQKFRLMVQYDKTPKPTHSLRWNSQLNGNYEF